MIGRLRRQLRRGRSSGALLLLGLGVISAGPAIGQETSQSELAAALRAEMAAMRAEYEARIRELESRLDELEAGDTAVVEGSSETGADELAALRAAAQQAAGDETGGGSPVPSTAPAVGRERNLSLLNPEISVTGIVVGNRVSDAREEFDAQEFELDIQSALDPFSKMRFTLAIGEEGVELEEGYLGYTGLPGGLELLVGRLRQRFGAVNRQHLHALAQSDYPLAYQAYFGDEGLAQTGLSFTWLLPRPWATANEVTLEITNGENEAAFSGESFDDFSVLGRVKSFWQLSDATYFEWGLSGIAGRTASGGDSEVYGTDVTVSWRPPSRAKYRELLWRLELLQAEREDLGVSSDSVGGYMSLEGLLRRNLYAGVRFDRVESLAGLGGHDSAITPYLTWWQSEYVRLRAEWAFFELGPQKRSEDRFTLQLTWAAGPHKHESY